MDTYSECNGCQTTWAAAKNGHLECLKYLHKNGCPWDKYATMFAAGEGHLEYLKYLHENGCPGDEYATWYAALNGHLECLKYLQWDCFVIEFMMYSKSVSKPIIIYIT